MAYIKNDSLLSGSGSGPANSVDNELSHQIGITVRVGSSVFDVSFLVTGDLPRNPDGRTAVRHSPPELFIRAGLMLSSESFFNPVTIVGDVEFCPSS